MARLVGIDHGDKRFGLALSDPTGTVARPFDTVEGEAALWARLDDILAEEDVAAFVVGLPRNMDGTLGEKARSVEAFAERLEQRSGLPVEMWDERLTTVQAERALRDGGIPLKRRRRTVDQVAAQILLQSYLDRRGRREAGGAGED